MRAIYQYISVLAIGLILAGCSTFSGHEPCPEDVIVIPELSAGDGGKTLYTLASAGDVQCQPAGDGRAMIHKNVLASVQRNSPVREITITNPKIFIAAVDEANHILNEQFQRLSLTLPAGASRAEKQFPLTATIPMERVARVYIGYATAER